MPYIQSLLETFHREALRVYHLHLTTDFNKKISGKSNFSAKAENKVIKPLNTATMTLMLACSVFIKLLRLSFIVLHFLC